MQQEQYIRIDKYGDKFVYKDKHMSVFHNRDGPAIEYSDGTKAWYANNKLHRTDGPAIEYSDGDKAWYVNGQNLTEEQFDARYAKPTELTLEDIAAKFGVDVNNLKIIK